MNISEKFLTHIQKHWCCYNTYDKTYKDLSEKSGVYIFASCNFIEKTLEIVYVGSTTNLLYRHKSHKVPQKIENISRYSIPVLFFLEMQKGFFDYERKLIKKLNPIFNTHFKQGRV